MMSDAPGFVTRGVPSGPDVMDCGSGAVFWASSLNTCFGSRNLGSMNFGARKSWQTTKISAETLLWEG